MTEDKMRKAWTFALFLIPLLSLAQQGPNRFPPINIYHGNPNGQACTTSMAIVQSDQNGKSYTCFGGVWGPGSEGGIPGGSNLQLQFNNAGAFGGATGVTVDSATKSVVSGKKFAGSGPPMLDITSSIYGGLCDGSNDDTAALQAAINALPLLGGNVLVVGSPSECWIQHPETLNYGTHTGPINFYISGTAGFGTTWSIPPGKQVNVYGYGGGNGASFQGPGPVAKIYSHLASGTGAGTLGTAVTVTTGTISSGTNTLTVADPTGYSIGDSVTLAYGGSAGFPLTTTITNIAGSVFTLANNALTSMTSANTGNIVGHGVTFTPSNMGGLAATAWLNVTGTTTCTLATGPSRANGKVTATYTPGGGNCNIPAGAGITVAGVADSSFNGAYAGGSYPQNFMLISNDYVAGTLTWNQTGTTVSSSGGSITGMNEDSIDHIQISSCTVSTCTATFWRAHSSSDAWGLITLSTGSGNSTATNIENIQITNYVAPGIMLGTPQSILKNVGIAGTGGCNNPPTITNFPLEIETSFVHIEHLAVNECGMPWGIRISNPNNAPNGIAGPIYIKDSFVMGGIELDHGAGQVYADNVVFDQSTSGAIQFDPSNYWATGPVTFELQNSGYNDNPNKFNNTFIYQKRLSTATLTQGNVSIRLPSPTTGLQLVNDYFTGALRTDASGAYAINTPRGPIGTLNTGRLMDTELRGEQAGFAPAVIPFATQNVVTNPASWPTSSCSVATGVLAPDGTTTAGALTKASGTGAALVFTWSGTPAVGDQILFGDWLYSSTPGTTANPGGQGFYLDNFGSAHFTFSSGTQATNVGYDALVTDDWWHPSVALATIATADGTAGNIRFNLSCAANFTVNHWQPFFIYIPASANIPLREINRWRQELLHGFVPPVAVAGQVYSGYPINLPGDPTANNQAATKNYVDARVSGVAQILDFTTGAAPGGIGCTGTNPYTCTGFPTGTHICTVYVIGGGAGGGSGAVEPSGTAAFGGGGGTGGAMESQTVPCSNFGAGTTATVVVTVGAGGNGGNAQAGTGANGNTGTFGGISKIAGATGYQIIQVGLGGGSGTGGAGGTTTTGAGGSIPNPVDMYNICPGAAGSSGTGGTGQCTAAIAGPGGGAGGGGIVAGPTAAAGGAISTNSSPAARIGTTAYAVASLTGGANTGGAGQTPTFTSTNTTIGFLGALGGTGGGGNTGGNGGQGGVGMFPGGGGGGGGAALNGSSSGAGGKGGDGLVRIIVQ